MASQPHRKHGLSRAASPEARTAARVLVVVVLVAAAPLVAGTTGAATVDSGTTDAASQTAEAAVDIVIVFDRSESTNEDRYQMAQEVDELASRFDDANIDARYGLVTYNETNQVEQPLTSDFDSFEAAMHFTEGGNEERASDAILTATNMDFRDDAETMVIVVTDEDDDSSNATRDAALSSLSGVHFVAVSPSSPSQSSCSVHSPPCDNRSDNELRTMASQVGGDWISEGEPADAIVAEIADIAASTVESGESSSRDAGSTSTRSADLNTVNRSANRTTVEVGNEVRFNTTIENAGTAEGTFEAYLSRGGTILTERTVSVPAGESRTVSFVHRFENAGEYEILVTHELVATVTVTEPKNTTVDVAAEANESQVNAAVTDAWTNETVSIPTAEVELAPQGAAAIESVLVSTGKQNVTPAHDLAFDAQVVANETPPNGTDPLPDHVDLVRYITVDSGLDGDAGVQFEYVPAASETTLYRYDAGNATWAALGQSAVNGTDALLRTEHSNATLYAVGVPQPAMSVTEVVIEPTSVVVGEPTNVTVAVSNDGAATGRSFAAVRLNGDLVGFDDVTVPADSTRTVVFTVTPDEPGTYTLDVAGGPSRTLRVDAASTATTTTTTDTSPTTQSPITTTASGTSTSSPGFGVVAALVALAGAALLARRRT